MCAPRVPKPTPIPERQAARNPDNGDPLVREATRSRARLATSAMIFAGRNGTLGMPSVTGPSGLGNTGAGGF